MGAARLMAPLRFVLDTNVVVSALIFRSGRSAWLREAWRTERIVPLISSPTIAELTRVLAYRKFGLSLSHHTGRLSAYVPGAKPWTCPAIRLFPTAATHPTARSCNWR